MARPKVSQAQKRSVRFSFRLTNDEQQKLAKLAKTFGVAPSVLVRDRIFKGHFPQPRTPRLDLYTYTELKKIGVNLNQVVKRINLGYFPKEFTGLLVKLLQQQETIIIKLLNDSQSKDR